MHQKHTHVALVVCIDREAQKRPAESNSTPAMDLGHMNVVFEWCMCMLVVDLGIGMTVIIISIIMMTLSFCLCDSCFFPPFFLVLFGVL